MGKGFQHPEIMDQTFSEDNIGVKEVENLSVHFCDMTTLGENSESDVSINQPYVVIIHSSPKYLSV